MRGEARFTADIQLPGMLHTAVLRSPHAHARVRRIDFAQALALPGVRAALGPGRGEGPRGGGGLRRRAGRRRRRRHASAQARAALAAVEIEWEELEVVLDPEEAVARELFTAPSARYERGDFERALAEADVVVEGTYRTSVVLHNSMETHQAVCEWVGDTLNVYISTQYIWGVRDAVAKELGIPGDKVRVVCEFMGGGFGSKNGPDEYTFVAAELAKRTGRPVRCALTRREENTAAGNRNATLQKLTVGATSDGTIVALGGEFVNAVGWSGWSAMTRVGGRHAQRLHLDAVHLGCRDAVAKELGMPGDKVRVVCEYMGGGFGSKNGPDEYTFVAAELAKRTGRPVRCALTRREENTAAGNRNATLQRLTVGAKSDGTIVALGGEFINAVGWSGWSAMTEGPTQMLYACENVRTVRHGAKINTPPMKAFRAPGFVEGTFSLECLIDELAAKLELDPLELRRRNYADSNDGKPFSSKNLMQCYELAQKHWDRRDEVRARSTDTWKHGVGMASQIWFGGGGPPSYAWIARDLGRPLHRRDRDAGHRHRHAHGDGADRRRGARRPARPRRGRARRQRARPVRDALRRLVDDAVGRPGRARGRGRREAPDPRDRRAALRHSRSACSTSRTASSSPPTATSRRRSRTCSRSSRTRRSSARAGAGRTRPG